MLVFYVATNFSEKKLVLNLNKYCNIKLDHELNCYIKSNSFVINENLIKTVKLKKKLLVIGIKKFIKILLF